MVHKKVKSVKFSSFFRNHHHGQLDRHTTNAAHRSPTPAAEQDAVEAIVPLLPIVLPVVGGVLMFLLAFIAVSMA